MAEPVLDLREAVARYDRQADRDWFREAEEQRQEIVKRFPLADWPNLPLERFAVGQQNSEDTFCRWLEFRARNLGGMGGGSSRKLIIYKHKEKPGWYYPPGFTDERQAWEAVHAGFVEAFDRARNQQWDAIDDIEILQRGSALTRKAVHVYFPADLLPIYSKPHIQHFLRLLGRAEGMERTDNVVRLNRTLLAVLNEARELEGWTTVEKMRLLYHVASPKETVRVVKIAPGEQARFWSDCLANGYICVGWDDLGDLREFDSKETFDRKFEDCYRDTYKGKLVLLCHKN